MKQTRLFMLCVSGCILTGTSLYGDSRAFAPSPLTEAETNRFTMLARGWATRLWTNDYYMSLGYVNYTNQHTVLQPFKIGMYDCEKFGIWFDNNKTEDRVHFRQVEVEYRSKSVPRPALVRICFLNRFSDTIAYLCNSLYVYSNVPYRWGPDKNPVPFHVKQEEAIEKAIEYASMFGVSNLTDTALFKQSECGLNSGEWQVEWTRLFNGYATWRGVSVSVADLPGAPLGRFHNTLVWLPEKMPTRIVLTPERAKAKAHEYMKKYFPFKDVASRMVCTTNWLQYASPDYNFTPHGMDSTDYVPKRDAIHLAYYNAFGSTNKDDNPSGAIIYVDAETGEMLGGYDNGK